MTENTDPGAQAQNPIKSGTEPQPSVDDRFRAHHENAIKLANPELRNADPAKTLTALEDIRGCYARTPFPFSFPSPSKVDLNSLIALLAHPDVAVFDSAIETVLCLQRFDAFNDHELTESLISALGTADAHRAAQVVRVLRSCSIDAAYVALKPTIEIARTDDPSLRAEICAFIEPFG